MPPAKKRRTAARAAAERHEKDTAAIDGSTTMPTGEDGNNTNSVLTTKLLEQHRETKSFSMIPL